MQEERVKWETERIRLADERTSYRRMIRDQARRETFTEMLVRRAAEADTPLSFKPARTKTNSGRNDIVVHMTDLHAGIKINNYWNSYDEEILKDRLKDYLQQIYDIQDRHKSENCFVILGGDMISGGIHPTLRIENNQDIIDQLLTVIELLSQTMTEISRKFKKTHVYLVPGNHGRIQPNKDENLSHENLDNLILPYMRAKLQNYKNIICHDNKIDQSMAVFEVRNKLIYASHGDRDPFKKVLERASSLLGRRPDIIFLGHMHHNHSETQSNTKIIQSGSLSGMDQYCVDKRIAGKPEQTVSIIDNKGLLCSYEIRFSK